MSLISNTKLANKIARYNTGRGANQPDYDNLHESTIGTIGSIDNEDNFNADSKITSALDIALDELVRKDAVIRIKEEVYINVGESRGWARMTSSMGQEHLSTLCYLYAPVSFNIVAAPYVEYMSTSIKIPVVSVGNTFTQGNVRYAFRYHSGSHIALVPCASLAGFNLVMHPIRKVRSVVYLLAYGARVRAYPYSID